MFEPDSPHRVGALAGVYDAAAQPAKGNPEVTFELRTGLILVGLRGVASKLNTDAMLRMPAKPNTAIEMYDGHLMWLGPDEWLLSTGSPAAELLANWPGDATEVSHGRSVLRLGGPSAREFLATGIGIDLRPQVFSAGACAQTLYGGVHVLLHCLPDGEHFDLYLARSYALHAWEMLSAAAQEFGYSTK